MMQSLAYDIEAVMVEAIASGLFVSLCTLQAPSGVFGPSGAPDGVYVPVAGLVDIPCIAPPLQAGETRTLQEIEASDMQRVLLAGYYPTIDEGWRNGWQAVVDGVAYILFGVRGDSQNQSTELTVKRVTN